MLRKVYLVRLDTAILQRLPSGALAMFHHAMLMQHDQAQLSETTPTELLPSMPEPIVADRHAPTVKMRRFRRK